MKEPQGTWWHTRDEEHLWGSAKTRDEAIDQGIDEYGGEPFFICQGAHFRNRTDIFSADYVADMFDDANEEYAGEENASEAWKTEHMRELEDELNAVMAAWVERHGYHKAWAIDAGPSERITAEMIAARLAERAA